MKRLMMLGCLIAAGSALGDPITLTLDESNSGTTFDWSVKENYKNAPRNPAAGDTVVIPDSMVAKLDSTDTTSWDLVSSLKCVTPSDGASFSVLVASGSATLGCAISWYPSSASSSHGKLVKLGAGDLVLARTDDSFLTGPGPSYNFSSIYYNYRVNFDIQGGAVKLPTGEEKWPAYYLGDVNLGADGTLYIANWNDGADDKETHVRGLTGSGTIRSDTPSVRKKLVYQGYAGVTNEFAGAFHGKVWLNCYGRLNYRGTSPNQNTDATRVQEDGYLGFESTSLFGSGNLGGKGTMRYLGTGTATLLKGVWLTDSFTLDAGASGKISLQDKISAGDVKLLSFTFAGDSAIPSVFSSVVYHDTARKDAVVHLVKRGTGIWELRNNANSNLSGGIDVENGILRFDTIAEQGKQSALGDSTRLYSNVVAAVNAKYAVPWAFLLGGDGTEGFLEYDGTTTAYCSTRPFAIRSTGGVNASQAAAATLSLSGFSAAGAGAQTLVLGGTNTTENIAANISAHTYSADGQGTLGVEKRGPGTWRLRGEQSFSGPLDVKDGTLVVENATAFRFFRFYIKENAFSACTNNTADGYYANMIQDDCIRWKNESGKYWGTNEFCAVQLSRFHLLDANGALAVSNCTMTVRTFPWTSTEGLLPENTFTFSGGNLPDSLYLGNNQDPQNIFLPQDSPSGYRAAIRFSKYLKLDDPSTWGCITVRVPDDAPEIYGYDIRMYKAEFATPFDELTGRALVSWEVHGSVDGANWEKLHELNSFKIWGGSTGSTATYWAYDQTNATSFTASHANGKFYQFSRTRPTGGASANALGNVSRVSVASGAVLDVRGAPLTLNNTTVRIGAGGMGELKNVAFGANGTLELDGLVPGVSSQFIPANLSGATGLGNLSRWALDARDTNGKHRRGAVTVTASGILYCDAGLMVIVR